MQSRLNLKVSRLSKHIPFKERINPLFFFNFTVSQNDIMGILGVSEIEIKAKGFNDGMRRAVLGYVFPLPYFHYF